MGRLVNTVVMEVTTITQQVNKGALGGGAEGDTTLELLLCALLGLLPPKGEWLDNSAVG